MRDSIECLGSPFNLTQSQLTGSVKGWSSDREKMLMGSIYSVR